MKTTLNLQERLLSELHPADYNPRVAGAPVSDMGKGHPCDGSAGLSVAA